jgi:hypothetical protein
MEHRIAGNTVAKAQYEKKTKKKTPHTQEQQRRSMTKFHTP